ncbi:muts domain V-domain-containing protein [Infundibulicybe gibba]|nr:muts domain V-domain-containing protein [Infundibulicybe gibba]
MNTSIPTSLPFNGSRSAEAHPRNVLAQEILENLNKFPHCILLTRVGQFYESYFSQAQEVSRLLNIKLTTRKWDGQRIDMCGFPLMHLDKYLKILVQKNKRFVAMCEEFPRYTSYGAKEFDRRIVRVITPGTLIDESFLNPFENNYLLAIASPGEDVVMDPATGATVSPIGLAWIDVSTGEFFSKPSTLDNLRDELARISPREVVLSKFHELNPKNPIRVALDEEHHVVSFCSTTHESVSTRVSAQTSMSANPEPEVSLTSQETCAISLLTTFLHCNLMEHMPDLSTPRREGSESRMQIDSHTIKALEIRESMREGGTTGSLISSIRRTVTNGGTRLLLRWLSSPSTDIAEITARQSLVVLFRSRPHFQNDLTGILKRTEDIRRITQKFVLGRGDANDLLAISSTIHSWTLIWERIREERRLEAVERSIFQPSDWSFLDMLLNRMRDLTELSSRIVTALKLTPDDIPVNGADTVRNSEADNETSVSFGYDKWTINPTFSDHILMLHTELDDLLREKQNLENTLRQTYDAPSLTLRSSPAQGMHVHLAKLKRDRKKLDDDSAFITLAESASTKCYFHKAWSQLGARIVNTTAALTTAEKEALEKLRTDVNGHVTYLRHNAHIVDEIDVALSFAKLAADMNFVRPTIMDDGTYRVVNGRHPTVELGLLEAGRVFTANSIEMNPSSNLHIITGPNMGGKSTFLRQVALIAVLAQAGSYVPADSATIGIVDRVFSRIGAKDDLFHDRSTFMVEMLETADILRRATPKSLVIMDEVGRGTNVQDGLAIAFAAINHLVSVNQCRALFATHFHELSNMIGHEQDGSRRNALPTVSYFCTDVHETDDDHFAYSYCVRPGINRDSHGLKVARLAGLPSAALTVAERALVWLKRRERDAGCQSPLGQYLP